MATSFVNIGSTSRGAWDAIAFTSDDATVPLFTLDVSATASAGTVGNVPAAYLSAEQLALLTNAGKELVAYYGQAVLAGSAALTEAAMRKIVGIINMDDSPIATSVAIVGGIATLSADPGGLPRLFSMYVPNAAGAGFFTGDGAGEGGGGGPPAGPAGGDLGGNYPNPDVVGLDGDALPANVGDGFLKRDAANAAWEQVAYGNAANTVCEGDDARLSDSRAPSGAAGGVLGYPGSTYPNPTGLAGELLAPGVIPFPTPLSIIRLPPAPNEAQMVYGGSVTGNPGDISGIIGLLGGEPADPGMRGGYIIIAGGPGADATPAIPGGQGGVLFWSAGGGGDGDAAQPAGEGGSVEISAGAAGADNGGGGALGGTFTVTAGADSDGGMAAVATILGGEAAGRASSAWTIIGCSGTTNNFGGDPRPPSPAMMMGPVVFETMNASNPGDPTIGQLGAANAQIDTNLTTAGTSFLFLENTSGGPLVLNAPPAGGTITKPEVATVGALGKYNKPRLLILENTSPNSITFDGEATTAGTNLLLVGGSATIDNGGRLTLLWSPQKDKWIELCRALNPT